jgi:DNA mismatch repair protein MutL
MLAVERHATSKVRTLEDLQAIATLGFRGEALPSIASVSRFVLYTHEAGALSGTALSIGADGRPQTRDWAGSQGTRVDVGELFYNVPARLKFLKRDATELGHVQGLVTSFALGYPYVHFRLVKDGKLTLDFPAVRELAQRVFQVLGPELTERLFGVESGDGVRVRGFASEPSTHKSSPGGITTFVNGRQVHDRVIQHALVAAYGNLLDRGRYPYAVLYLHLDTHEVDVNVHPAKSEVRFADSGRVHSAIYGAVARALAATPWVRNAHERRAAALETPAAGPPAPEPVSAARPPFSPAVAAAPEPLPRQMLVLEPPSHERRFFQNLRVVGQVARTYLVCEDATGVHLIDQHAAHERVGYERIKAGYCTARLAQQRLLLPLCIELSPAESSVLKDHLDTFAQLGFEVEAFGGATWHLVAIPALLIGADPASLVKDVVAELSEVGHASLAQAQLDLLFSTMACHRVVRAGDRLSNEEIRQLLVDMDEVDLGANCPHGRPVLVSLPFSELERRFHRR